MGLSSRDKDTRHSASQQRYALRQGHCIVRVRVRLTTYALRLNEEMGHYEQTGTPKNNVPLYFSPLRLHRCVVGQLCLHFCFYTFSS
jgi:hypothetical protein